jgi:DnaJ-class molecular chaperone
MLTGGERAQLPECPKCKGHGVVMDKHHKVPMVCPYCNGYGKTGAFEKADGRTPLVECPGCEGHGKISPFTEYEQICVMGVVS